MAGITWFIFEVQQSNTAYSSQTVNKRQWVFFTSDERVSSLISSANDRAGISTFSSFPMTLFRIVLKTSNRHGAVWVQIADSGVLDLFNRGRRLLCFSYNEASLCWSFSCLFSSWFVSFRFWSRETWSLSKMHFSSWKHMAPPLTGINSYQCASLFWFYDPQLWTNE